MLKLIIPAGEFYNETTEEFISTKAIELQLEHSLISVSKWESKWRKAFLSKGEKSKEETIDYVRAMTLTQNVDFSVFDYIITQPILNKILDYIEDPMSATYIYHDNINNVSREKITSELIYYWMVAFQISFECQKWHLNRLLTLIEVCNIKSNPNKKRLSNNQIRARNKSLNNSRRKQIGTRG